MSTYTDDLQRLGSAIRQARDLRRWTQAQLTAALSEYLGKPIQQPSVNDWEHGKNAPTFRNLVALYHVLGLSIDDVLDVHAGPGDGGAPRADRLRSLRDELSSLLRDEERG